MRVLLTGASGFIGRHLAARLAARHELLEPTHGELDLTDAAAVRGWFRAHPVDAVVHAAVKPGHRNAADPSGLLAANLAMFFSLADCRGSFGRFVVLSSGAVYDVSRALELVTEEEFGSVRPIDEHGLSKFSEAVWLEGDDDAVELRVFGVYGPGEDYAIRFVSNACCKALFELPITLRRDRRFSYLWVDDLAAVAEQALGGALPTGAYNVTPDEPVDLRRVADLVLAAAGKDLPVVVAERGAGLPYTGSNAKLRAALPELAFTAMEDGVTQLYEWYAARREQIKRGLLLVDK